MEKYIGTKLLNAEPMTLGAYNILRGWNMPEEEDAEAQGYLVEYLDGSPANHENYAGYISWSPKAVFEAAYQTMSAMNFGHALEMLKRGEAVSRAGWNGKGMFLFLVPEGESSLSNGMIFEAAPFIVMKTADDKIVPWLCSQTDALADDWGVIELTPEEM